MTEARLVQLVRDAMGLGGAGVEKDRLFNAFTLTQAQKFIETMEWHGYYLARLPAAAPAEGLLHEVDTLLVALNRWERAWQTTSTGYGDVADAKERVRAALARHESADDDEFELESIHHGGNGPEGSR